MEDRIIKKRIASVLPIQNEKQTRIYLAAEAISTGWGGKSEISRLSGVSRAAISHGKKIWRTLIFRLEKEK
jgi:hypothetical protein